MAFSPQASTASFGYEDGFQTTLSSSITASTTAIPLTGLPTPTEGTLVIEPGTANEEEIYYTSSGAGVVNCPSAADGRGLNGTTAVTHTSGAAVKMLVSKASFDVIKFGGALSTGTSAIGIRAAAIRLEAWGTHSSTITGFSGTPTQSIKYIKYGRTLHVEFSITGTSNATSLTFTLPFAAANALTRLGVYGTDNGTALTNGARIDTSAASAVVTATTTAAGAAWTNSGTKALIGSFTCETTT